MTLIRQYVDALLDQDALALSKLFSPTAIFVDHCPRDAGKPLVSTYGPEAIDMFYHNRFLFRHFRIYHRCSYRQRHAGLLLCRL